MIVIGSIHFNDCPAEPYIPLFLIVGGMYSANAGSVKVQRQYMAPLAPTENLKRVPDTCPELGFKRHNFFKDLLPAVLKTQHTLTS